MSDRKRKLENEDDGPHSSRSRTGFSSAGAVAAPASSNVNPYTGRAYSQHYHDILAKRLGESQSMLKLVQWASVPILWLPCGCPCVQGIHIHTHTYAHTQACRCGKPRRSSSR